VDTRLGVRVKGELLDLESQLNGKKIEACKLADLEDVLRLYFFLNVLQLGMYAGEFLK
jgi:hypothetical protein